MRRRRKGGGRKPKPPGEGKTAQFQARISSDLRAALDTEAAATGGRLSVSAIASGLLKDGLRVKREREFERDDPMRALWYLVAETAKEICGSREGRKPGLDWRTNPFAYEAFKLAIVKIMDSLRPAGDIRPPAASELRSIALFGPFDTAEARAEHVAKIILHNLHHAEAMDVEKMFGPDLPNDLKARLERTVYNMSDARRALVTRPAFGTSQMLPRGKKLGSKAPRNRN
jgi:hypothetical protein